MIMNDKLSPAQRKALYIALKEGKITVGNIDQTPGVQFGIIQKLFKKGYLDFKEPESSNIESEWVPSPKAILYKEEFMSAKNNSKKKTRKHAEDKKYQVKVPVKGYQLYNVTAKTAQEAKQKVDDSSDDIEIGENFVYVCAKAIEAIVINESLDDKDK